MNHLINVALCLALALLPGMFQPAAAQAGRPAAADEGDIRATILALERQRIDAILRRDVPTLRTLMDRQYSHVIGRGRARSKTELLTALDRNELRFRFYEIESADVDVLGNVVLVTGVFRSLQQHPGAQLCRAHYVRLWVRQPDGWKNRFHQATEIRPGKEAPQCN